MENMMTKKRYPVPLDSHACTFVVLSISVKLGMGQQPS